MAKSFVLAGMVAAVLSAFSGGASRAGEPATEVIAYSARKPSTLFAGSNSRNMFVGGALGAMINLAEGSDIAKKHGLQDPQDQIAIDLARSLAERRNASLAATAINTDSKSAKAIASQARPARYVVDVETLTWSFSGGYMELVYYSVHYWARLRVIDVQTGEVAVTDKCKWMSPDDQRSKRVELLADDAQRLKALFATGVETCLRRFEAATAKLAAEKPAFASPVLAEVVPAPRPVRAAEAPPRTEAMQPIIRVAPAPLATIQPLASSNPDRAIVDDTSRRPQVFESPPAAIRPHLPSAPAYVEYPYARPNEAPPSRKPPPPEYRYAGRDANGFLTWPGKRP